MVKFISAFLSLIFFAFSGFPAIISESKTAREERITALESGAQVLSTDYPKKTDMTDVDYYVDFEGGTARIIK